MKFTLRSVDSDNNSVAPHAGAWIEMQNPINLSTYAEVAPHAGAWIEILIAIGGILIDTCRSPCGSVD